MVILHLTGYTRPTQRFTRQQVYRFTYPLASPYLLAATHPIAAIMRRAIRSVAMLIAKFQRSTDLHHVQCAAFRRALFDLYQLCVDRWLAKLQNIVSSHGGLLLVPEEESFVLPAKTILLNTLQINETYTSKSSPNCGFRVLLEGAVLKEILH